MNYEIIKDEKAFREFIEWLPELQPHEKFYFCLFARSKYTKDENGVNGIAHIKSDKSQLKRGTSDKARLFDKIKQLEVEVGAYKQRDIPIPQEALALYINPNPSDMYKASINTMCKLAQSIRDQNVMMNPHQEALSEIQKSRSRTCWLDFDMDYKPNGEGDSLVDKMRPLQFIGNLQQEIRFNCGNSVEFEILETRGGYHILINPDSVEKAFKSFWYKNMSAIGNIDQVGDLMIPVPGCTQGEFIPKFIK